MNFCNVLLPCADSAEATTIAQSLLQLQLIVCAKQVPVGSDFLWHGKVDHNDEILLIMESREDLFDEIEAVVSKLHSYDTFVLEMFSVKRVSKKASEWMSSSLKRQ